MDAANLVGPPERNLLSIQAFLEHVRLYGSEHRFLEDDIVSTSISNIADDWLHLRRLVQTLLPLQWRSVGVEDDDSCNTVCWQP